MLEIETKVQRYERYIDSGVEWLGEIPEHWDLGRLGSILNPVSSKNHPNETLLSITREKGVIVRDMENEDDNHNYIPYDLTGYKLLKEGQFGMNKMKAWQGSYGVSGFTGIVSPAYYTFEFTKEIEPRFFHVAIRSKLYVSFFGKASDGVRIGQWDLSKDRMKRIPFAIPPLKEQTAIAQFLDDKTKKIDEAITIKEQQIKLLKERKQIVIHKAVTQGLNPNVKLKDSGVEWIGEIPEHWEVKRLKYLGNTFAGITGKSGEDFTKEEKEGFKPFVPFTSIFSNELIDTSKHQFVKIRENEGQNRVIKGDLLFLMSSETLEDIGKCSIYLGLENELYLNSFCKGFRFSNPIINAVFTNHLLQSFSYRHYFSLKGRGFTRINIKQEFVLAIPILIPPLSEQKEIASYIETASKKIETAINLKQQEITKLKEYKSSLINSVVTGKVKVC